MTIQEAAQRALDIQDACNLSAVVHEFDEVIGAVWDEAHRLKQGTGWVNHHPICIAFVDKMAHLQHLDRDEKGYNDAYQQVVKIARGQA